MGGKSSSSSSQTSTQKTNTATSDGVVAGNLTQGETITITDNFPEGVQKVFQDLINLTGDTIDKAASAANTALTTVSERVEQTDNPQLAALTKAVPVVMFGIAAIAVILIFKKR